MNALTALKLAIEEWDGISGYDDTCGSTDTCGLYAARYDGPFDASEILEAIGDTHPLEDLDLLAPINGAIYTVDDIGQREVRLYSTRSDLMRDWREYQDELDPMSYTVSGGNRVTIYSGSGRSVAFLQDEDGSRLAEELASCKNDEEIQTILEPYRD